MHQTIETTPRAALAFQFFDRKEAELMLYMATGGDMDALPPDQQDAWEDCLEAFKDFCLSI